MTIVNQGTAGVLSGAADIVAGSVGSPTRALSLKVDYLRSRIDIQAGEVHVLHGEARSIDLRQRSLAKSRKSVAELLEELSLERGMSWTDIAEMTGVSVSAVRKWRQGGDANGDRRARLAELAAFLDVLEDKGIVSEPAQWMEMPLPLDAGYIIRPLDLYADGFRDELIDLAEQRRTMEHILDDVRPGWRDQRSAFEVFTDGDGDRALRLRAN